MKELFAEPYKIKIVEPIRNMTRDERLHALDKASYNTYRLREEEVYLDFSNSRGNAAMSHGQWGGLMIGDEAYAGSVNFEHLYEAANEVFGKKFLIPTHRGVGAEHLIVNVLAEKGQKILGNTPTPSMKNLTNRYGLEYVDLTVKEGKDPTSEYSYKGDINLDKLRRIIKSDPSVAFVLFNTASVLNGGQAFSIKNFTKAHKIAKKKGIPVIVDASAIFTYGVMLKEIEKKQESCFNIAKKVLELADIVYLSAREDLMCHTGGLILTDKAEWYVDFRSLVVVFEGLHTYGGLAGRDLEAIAVSLRELKEYEFIFHRHETLKISEKIKKLGYQIFEPVGTIGILVDLSFLERGKFPAHAYSAALYLASGVRAGPHGVYLGIYIPRRIYTPLHFEYLIEALDKAKDLTDIPALELVKEFDPMNDELAKFRPTRDFPMEAHPFMVEPEPYKIKAVEPIVITSKDRREKAIEEAGWNTFLLKSQDVYIDMLTDSGTSAMSSEQWAKLVATSESLNFSEAHEIFVETIREIYGFPYVIPTHQGRAAEHILNQVLVTPGKYVPNNMYFTTSREHQERAGGIHVDVVIDAAHEPTVKHPFKGNIDKEKLLDLIKEVGPHQIAYVRLELNMNMGGGQPVSMDNAIEISEICHEFGIPLVYDATRAAENAYFIKIREPGMNEYSIEEIFKQLMSYADAITVSAKKDLLVNIGGFIATRDQNLFQKMEKLVAIFEGHPADGGLAKRDLVAMAVGAKEMLRFEHLRHRIYQVEYLANRLLGEGIPIVEPPGGHAVFLDAKRFLPHLPQDEFPAQRLAGEIYIASGVRTMERGIVSAGRDPRTGKHHYPKLELVRITIPRRVYTKNHLDVVADGIIEVFRNRENVKGLKMVFEPPTLRFFTARFKPIEAL